MAATRTSFSDPQGKGIQRIYSAKVSSAKSSQTGSCRQQSYWRRLSDSPPSLTVTNRYFKQNKLTSFQRQLNLYGFNRLTRGLDATGYYHQYFLRDREYLAKRMMRQRIKGTKIKGAASPDAEPDFYAMVSFLILCRNEVGHHAGPMPYPYYFISIDHRYLTPNVDFLLLDSPRSVPPLTHPWLRTLQHRDPTPFNQLSPKSHR